MSLTSRRSTLQAVPPAGSRDSGSSGHDRSGYRSRERSTDRSMDRSADSIPHGAPAAPNREGCESARAPTTTDRFLVLIGRPDRLLDAELEQDVLLRIVLPRARGRNERRVVYPRGAAGDEELP